MRSGLAATSVGIVEGTPVLDLTYEEDARARVDMNVVMTESGKFVGIQGTGEGGPFTKPEAAALAMTSAYVADSPFHPGAHQLGGLLGFGGCCRAGSS